MEKYFDTLDQIYRLFHVKQNQKISNQLLRAMRNALDGQHDAGPEANYIIRTWKQERGYE